MPEQTPPRHFHPSDLAVCLASAQLGPASHHEAFSVWPIVAPPAPAPLDVAPPYVALADALRSGHFRIEEVDDAGDVNRVVAHNSGDVCVLVLFGEELRGAKQNRIANASFLVPARSHTRLDVSCVEQGRWARRSAVFEASGAVFSSRSRRKMADKVAGSLQTARGFDADQGEVWSEVETKLRHSGAESATRAYADHLAVHTERVDVASQHFSVLPDQIGFVAGAYGQLTGLEIVGRSEVFARCFGGLLGSYLIDAIDAGPGGKGGAPHAGAARPHTPPLEDPEALLDAVATARTSAGPSLGLGEDVRIEGDGVTGCALFAGDVVHLTAFPESRSWEEVVY